MQRPGRIAIVGDHDPAQLTHAALDRAAARLAHRIHAEWVPTEELAVDPAGRLRDADGLWIAPASPYRSFEGAVGGIRHARERGVPLFAT